MGQRRFPAAPGRAGTTSDDAAWLMAFPTEIGWIGVLGSDRGIRRLTLGHPSHDSARGAIESAESAESAGSDRDVAIVEKAGDAALRRGLERYARGEAVDFRDVAVDLPAMTEFQRRVVEATRGIGYGETITYAGLGARSGNPGAARAVGSVMARNRIPLIIPCHRVLSAGGLGGYSAPQGLVMKRRLLEMEGTSGR